MTRVALAGGIVVEKRKCRVLFKVSYVNTKREDNCIVYIFGLIVLYSVCGLYGCSDTLCLFLTIFKGLI